MPPVTLPLPTHPELIRLLNVLYSLKKLGFCAGLRKMNTQAFLCLEPDIFYERLQDIKKRVLPFFATIQAELRNGAGNPGMDFQAEEKQRLLQEFSYRENYDPYAFFDGVVAYQNINDVSVLCPKGRQQPQGAFSAEPILLPVLYDEKKITRWNYRPFTGVYNEKTLALSLICITEALKDFSEPVSFSSGTGDHTFSFNFYRGTWSWFDANHMSERRQYRKNEIQDLGRLFADKYDSPIFLVIKLQVAPDLPKQKFLYLANALNSLWQNILWSKPYTYTPLHKRLTSGCGYTLAYIAAMHNDTRALSRLTSDFVAIIKKSVNQETPLHVAARVGNMKCVRILVDALVRHEPKVIASQMPDGTSALFVAAQNGHTHCVQILVNVHEQYNPMAINHFRFSDQATPLFIATQNGHTPCVEILVDSLKWHNPAALLHCVNTIGNTPLYAASKYGHAPCLGILVDAVIEYVPESLYFCTKSGETPLFVAVQNGHISCVRILVSVLPRYNSLALDFPTEEGKTPLSMAIENEHILCVQILLHSLQRHYPAAIYLPAPNGKSPLRQALYQENQECIRLITNALKKSSLPAHYFCIQSLLVTLDKVEVSDAKHQDTMRQLRTTIESLLNQFASAKSILPKEKNLLVTNCYHAVKAACEQLEAEHSTIIPWIESMIVFLNKYLYQRNCSFFGRRQPADIVQHQWEALCLEQPTTAASIVQ